MSCNVGPDLPHVRFELQPPDMVRRTARNIIYGAPEAFHGIVDCPELGRSAEISSVSWARARALVARQGLLYCTIRAKDAVKGRQLKDDCGLVTRPGNAEVAAREARCLEAPY